MRLVGCILLALSGFLVSRWYTRYLERRLAEGEACLGLIEHISGEISRYLTPPGRLLNGYRSSLLEELGFLERAGEAGFADAFAAVSRRLTLPKEGTELLSRLFRDFGRSYRDGELARLSEARDGLAPIVARLREELPRDIKLGRVLVAAAVLGGIILLI